MKINLTSKLDWYTQLIETGLRLDLLPVITQTLISHFSMTIDPYPDITYDQWEYIKENVTEFIIDKIRYTFLRNSDAEMFIGFKPLVLIKIEDISKKPLKKEEI